MSLLCVRVEKCTRSTQKDLKMVQSMLFLPVYCRLYVALQIDLNNMYVHAFITAASASFLGDLYVFLYNSNKISIIDRRPISELFQREYKLGWP